MKYYGSGDLAGVIFVKNVINSINTLEKHIAELNSDILDLEDLYRYLWLLSFKEMSNEIDSYKIDYSLKQRIKSLSEKIDYTPSRFIKYINSNYSTALNKEAIGEIRWYQYFEILMKLIYEKYVGGFSQNVFLYIEEKYPLNILANYQTYAKYYSEHQDRIPFLFRGLKQTRIFDDNIYCAFLLNNRVKGDKFFKEQAQFICERSLRYIKSLELSSDNQEILQIQSRYLSYRKLAIVYGLLCANEYNSYKHTIELCVSEYLKKHGHKLNIGLIDFKSAIDLLKSSKDIWRFIQLTHTKQKGVINNNFNRVFLEKPKESLSEFVNRLGQPRSEKYPYYKQDSMNINMWVNCNILFLIFNDEELFNDFANYLFNLSNQVEEEFFRGTIEIEEEMSGIFELIANMLILIKNSQNDTPLYKALTNGCVLNECGLIEKILRNIALLDDKEVSYFDPDSNTIGTLFKNHKFTKLSDGLVYYLEFYLSRENNEKLNKDERPGKDIRNVQMHNHDEKYKHTDLNLCLELLFLLLSLLGDLFVNGKETEE